MAVSTSTPLRCAAALPGAPGAVATEPSWARFTTGESGQHELALEGFESVAYRPARPALRSREGERSACSTALSR